MAAEVLLQDAARRLARPKTRDARAGEPLEVRVDVRLDLLGLQGDGDLRFAVGFAYLGLHVHVDCSSISLAARRRGKGRLFAHHASHPSFACAYGAGERI